MLKSMIAINLGISYSVLDLVRFFEQTRAKQVPHRVAPSRAGDIAASYFYSSLFLSMLGLHVYRILNARRWQIQNPQGYAGA